MEGTQPVPSVATIVRGNTRQLVPPSCRFTVNDLRRLYDLLNGKADEAAELEISNLHQLQDQTAEQFQQAKGAIKSSLAVTVRVQGGTGEWVAATSAEALSDQALPATILSVEFNSAFLFRNQVRGEPQNSFSVFLDLSRTDILDMRTLSLMPSSNTSNAQISGINTTWVNGVYGELHTFFQNRATARSWLHGRYTYDALVILLGFPASFLVVREADRFLRPLVKWPEALLVAFYVYLVLVALFGFRILFNYARWVFPKIEVTSTHQPGVLHKSILVMVAAAVVSWVVESVLTVFTHGLSK